MGSEVLIEAPSRFAPTARDLLTAAHLMPVFDGSHKERACNTLLFLSWSHREMDHSLPIAEISDRIHAQVERTVHRHHDRHVVFCMPQMPEERFVRVCATFWPAKPPQLDFDLVNTLSDAVARILQRNLGKVQPKPKANFALDAVPGMAPLTGDLRDDDSGRVDAQKVAELFGVTLTDLAKAAGISKQGLTQTPDSEKAQPVLKLFERVARLRSNPQFKEPVALKKWFRQPLPIFSNHSAEELFAAGKLEIVAEKVDQLLTGDFGG